MVAWLATLVRRAFSNLRSQPPIQQDPLDQSCYKDVNSNEDYFKFTRSRFIVDEVDEMSQRSNRFNVPCLVRVAAGAVGSSHCISIKKCPDGQYNRALLLTMDNGKQVIAKIPNPNAGRPHFTTASEVATMDFVRNVLGTPVPEVFAWSSRAESNAVGAEYIIMENLPGVPLQDVWPHRTLEERAIITKNIARYQKAWTAASFHQFGSLYYRRDLTSDAQCLSYKSPQGEAMTDLRFAVGPSTGRWWMDHGRSSFEIDRGPWITLEDYARAVGLREAFCIRNLPKLPKSPVALRGPGTYQPTREKKLQALDCYLALLKYLLPNNESVTASCLWHDDLHLENIFVDPQKPTNIVGIIDWQSTELAPIYEHARQPFFLDFDGPTTQGLERARLPDNIAELGQEEQKDAKSLYYQQSLSVLYRSLVHKHIPGLYDALAFSESSAYDLVWPAKNLVVEGEAIYMAKVLEAEELWDKILEESAHPKAPFPLQFSDEARAKIDDDANAFLRGMEAMQKVKETLGDNFPEKGLVRHEQYDEALKALGSVKEEVIDTYAEDPKRDRQAWLDNWPFDEWKPSVPDADKS